MTEGSLLVVEDKTQEHHQSTLPAATSNPKSRIDETSASESTTVRAPAYSHRSTSAFIK